MLSLLLRVVQIMRVGVKSEQVNCASLAIVTLYRKVCSTLFTFVCTTDITISQTIYYVFTHTLILVVKSRIVSILLFNLFFSIIFQSKKFLCRCQYSVHLSKIYKKCPNSHHCKYNTKDFFTKKQQNNCYH